MIVILGPESCRSDSKVLNGWNCKAEIPYLIVYQSLCRFALGDPWVPKHKTVSSAMLSFSYSHSVVTDIF